MTHTGPVIAIALCVTATSALAQSHVSHAQFTIDQWACTPTYKVTSSGLRVDSILAIRDPGGVTGENIIAVWYKRPDTGCDKWMAKAWESGSDQWEAVKYIKDQLQISDDEDALWITMTSKPATIASNAGVDYEKGFEKSDPLGTALKEDPTRDWVMESLVASGYKVADNPLDKAPPDGCEADDWLCAMAVAAEHANNPSYSGNWTAPFFALAGNCAAYFAAPPMHTAVGTWGSWTWGAWTPYTLDHSDATTCYYRRTLQHQNCRTVTYPPGSPAPTVTQCVYQYCVEEITLPKNADGTCPPPPTPGTVGTPMGPMYPRPIGPSPGLPYIPVRNPAPPALPIPGLHPIDQPDCNGGLIPWP